MINRMAGYHKKLPTRFERVDLMPENEKSCNRVESDETMITWNPFDQQGIGKRAGVVCRHLPGENNLTDRRWVKLAIIGLAALLMCLFALTMESTFSEKDSSFFFPADKTPAALIPMESPDIV